MRVLPSTWAFGLMVITSLASAELAPQVYFVYPPSITQLQAQMISRIAPGSPCKVGWGQHYFCLRPTDIPSLSSSPTVFNQLWSPANSALQHCPLPAENSVYLCSQYSNDPPLLSNEDNTLRVKIRFTDDTVIEYQTLAPANYHCVVNNSISPFFVCRRE